MREKNQESLQQLPLEIFIPPTLEQVQAEVPVALTETMYHNMLPLIRKYGSVAEAFKAHFNQAREERTDYY